MRSAFQVMSDLHLEVGRQYPALPASPASSHVLFPGASSSTSPFVIPRRAPYLILAGDVGRLADYDEYRAFVAAQCAQFHAVFLVLGNHEFFGLSRAEGLRRADALQRDAAMFGRLFVLNRTRVDLPALAESPTPESHQHDACSLPNCTGNIVSERYDDNGHDTVQEVDDIADLSGHTIRSSNREGVTCHAVTLLGCTLHSDVPPEAREVVQQKVNDFRRIANWSVEDHVAEHARDVAWLRRELQAIANAPDTTDCSAAASFNILTSKQSEKQHVRRCGTRQVIVVTHHAPMVRGTSHPKYADSPWNAAFATALLDDAGVFEPAQLDFNIVDCWIYGHTHYSTDFLVGKTRLISNQRGYILPVSMMPVHYRPHDRAEQQAEAMKRSMALRKRLTSFTELSQWVRCWRRIAKEEQGSVAEKDFDVEKARLNDAVIVLSRLLTENGIRYGILGGHAVSILGGPRESKDVDCLVAADKGMIIRILHGRNGFAALPQARQDYIAFLWSDNINRTHTVLVEIFCDSYPGSQWPMTSIPLLLRNDIGLSQGKGSTALVDISTIFKGKLQAAAMRGKVSDAIDLRWLEEQYVEELRGKADQVDLVNVGKALRRQPELVYAFARAGIDIARANTLTESYDTRYTERPTVGVVQEGLLGPPRR